MRSHMNLSKSMEFLLENAGPVIKYRLHKEILKDIGKTEEENLLEKVLQAPFVKLVESYAKPNGYIGSGMHSWDNWGGVKLHETPLQDGETAARLLSYYAIPKTHPLLRSFIIAMRDEETLRQEFSYIPPEIERFHDRFLGINSGFSLMILLYTMQALLGYGDDPEVKPFVDTSFRTFERVLDINALSEITKSRQSKAKYNYPYIEQDTYFPCQYHLETLAHTSSWRNDERIDKLSRAVNHLCRIMSDDNVMHVKIRSNYYAPLWAYNRPFKPFSVLPPYGIAQRKTLTHLAMVGGGKIDVVRQSADAVKSAIADDGVLRVNFDNSYMKKRFKDNMRFPGPYSEISLETSHKTDTQLWCDLTFWAVQFLYILGEADF